MAVALPSTPTRAEQTAALVRIIAAAGRHKRRAIPQTQWPSATEREYARVIKATVNAAVAPAFVPLLDYLPRFVAMAKASQPFGADVRAAVSRSYDAMMANLKPDAIAAIARRYGQQVSQHTRATFQRQAVAALGVDITIPDDRKVQATIAKFVDLSISHLMAVPEMLTVDVEKRIVRALSVSKLDAAPRKGGGRPTLTFNRPATGTRTTALGFGEPSAAGTRGPRGGGRSSTPSRPDPQIVRNARLIVNRPEGFNARGIAAAVQRNVELGGSTRELAEELSDRFGFFEEHAAFIARDQVGKLQGQSTAARQQSLGLTRFVWRTAGDERVRDEHVDRDGEVYEYDDPPDGELPGEPINCRCTAEPVFEDVLSALDE